MALDAAMMVITAIVFNVLDPAVLLKDDDQEAFEKRTLESNQGSSVEAEGRAEVREK